jgi:hypothetical protein
MGDDVQRNSSFIVKFLNTSNNDLIEELVERQTFPEAASWAYRHRVILGYQWQIESIKKI